MFASGSLIRQVLLRIFACFRIFMEYNGYQMLVSDTENAKSPNEN